MIWHSVPLMAAFDVVIVLMIAVVFYVSSRYGMFKTGRMPRLGRMLILIGIATIGLFYIGDLLSMLVLPRYIGEPRAMEIMTFLHLELQWYVTFLAVLMIGAGVIVVAVQREELEVEMARSRDQMARVQSEIVQSEIRFRSLIEQTPDAVYCLEFRPPVSVDASIEEQIARSYDAVLVECNQVFADELEVDSPAIALGMRFGEMDATKDWGSHERFYRTFIESGYRLEGYELEYKDPAGDDRALRVSLTGVVQNGALVRIWGAEIDILEQKKTKQALIYRHRFQEFVAAMSSRLIKAPEEQVGETLQRCLQQVCTLFEFDRTSVMWFDADNRSARILYYWNEHGGPPWVEPTFENYPWAVPQLVEGRPVLINSVRELRESAPTDAACFAELGLASVIAVPLMIGADIKGAVAFGNLEAERDWSAQDVADLRVIADLIANVVNRLNAREELNSVLGELRVAKDRLEAENIYLREEISSTHGFDEIIGESPQIKRCLRQVEQVAGTSTAVLIQGETGTGKELIARAVHERSDRAGRPLVKVNCAALPANLIESELFGHEKGAFTGALTRKRGRFDLADGGTLFLDEIGDFPLELQGKLLRVIQEGEFQRLGGTDTMTVDVRLIAATNRDLQRAVDNGEFRADLFYRINTFPIYLPRLKERIGDIPILADHFARKHAALLGKEVTAISAPMMEQLNDYSWPGNIRELEGVIQRALISAVGSVLEAPELLLGDGPDVTPAPSPPTTQVVDLQIAERSHIERVLSEASWVIGGDAGAAAMLGIPPSTLRSKMKKLGIERPASGR